MRVFKRRRLVKKGLTTAIKRASGERPPALEYLDRGVFPRMLTGLVLLVLITFIVAKGRVYLPRLYPGRKAKQDVIATIDFRYEDKGKREQIKAKERAKVPAISRLDKAKITEKFETLKEFFTEVAAARKAAGEGADAGQWTGPFKPRAQELFPKLGVLHINQLLSDHGYATWVEGLRDVLLGLADVRTFQKRAPELQVGYECVSAAAFSRTLNATVKKAFPTQSDEVLATLMIIASDAAVFEDDTETVSLLQERRVKAVPPQYTEVKRGKTIISKDEIVTAIHLDKLRAFNDALRMAVSRETRYSYRATVGVTVAVLLGLCGLSLWRFEPRVFRHNSKLGLIGLVAVVALGLAKGIALIDPPNEWWGYFLSFPLLVAMPAMVVGMAFSVRVGFLIAMVLSILSGIHYDPSTTDMTMHPTFILLGLVGGTAAALYAPTIRYRREFIRSGAIIGLLNFLVIATAGILGGDKPSVFLMQGTGGLSAGLAATILTWLLLPTLETVFRITTNISLVELGDSNHPLLKRMVMEAPGTYHHSLIVGNLAESAAEAIEANPLLARVGAFYHDIGKLKKPDYFSENEQFARSRHDTLIPSMSSLIITSHVKDGVDLGVKYKLKPAILDIIREHHGTSLVYFFYKRAEQMNGEDANVDEADYRYPGPRPQSKESAIIMLADAVEAATRAMEKPTAGKIRTLVRDLILARFNDGQLDESDLTLRDLHRVQQSFTHIILGTLHQRVKYPKEGKPGDESPTEGEAKGPETKGAEDRPDQQLTGAH